MADPHDDEPPEHRRYAQYLKALDSVAEADEVNLLAAVLRDDDTSMAESAVNHHLERRAAEQLTSPQFRCWAQMMATVIGDRTFLSRRLREWTLLRSIALDEPWTDEELLTASDWFQRTAASAQLVTSPDALRLLAEHGRTRRVRNAASRRTQRPSHAPVTGPLSGSRPFRWLPYDASSLARLGVGGEAGSALVERGLPTDCNRMFVRDSGRELDVRDLPPGRAAFLGAFEDGVNTYWLLIDSGEVWMVRGYEGKGDQQYGLVNSSVGGLQNVLEVWEAFAFSGKSDADDDYEDFVEVVLERARQSDPRVFEDDNAWWSRVFEEVELGMLVPEEG